MDFYIVENNGDYYIQYFDVLSTSSFAIECAEKFMVTARSCDMCDIGMRTKEYQDFVRKKCMSDRIYVDKKELDVYMDKISKCDISGLLNETIKYKMRTTHLMMVDYINGIEFLSDDYLLKKYSVFVELFEYVLDKCKICGVKKCNLKYIKSIEKAYKILVDKHLRYEYGVL